ncbi:putative short chain dehydrogenase family protein [Coniochaeta sp. 2T2.1]|nr:putative short chain dehydrogenase family protein [Coniochaeta sp. 2T2.1]
MGSNSETIVLITGANKGVGRSTAIALARDHGYTVIIGSRDPSAGKKVASELVSQGHKADSVQLDVLSDSSIAGAAKFVEDTYGRLDVLIANHGQFLDKWNPNIPDLSTRELWTQSMAINVVGTAVLVEHFLPLLRKAKPAPKIIFLTTSMASLANALDKSQMYYHLNGASYITSKTAVNMLALQTLKRLDDVPGAKVNVACPGLVNTDLVHHMYPGAKTPEQGAEYVVKLATDDALVRHKNGSFGSTEGAYPW